MGFLTEQQMRDLHEIVIAAKLSRASLLVNIPRLIEAGLRQAGNERDQIWHDLHTLNELEHEQDGQLLFRLWLENAIHLADTSHKPSLQQFLLPLPKHLPESYNELCRLCSELCKEQLLDLILHELDLRFPSGLPPQKAHELPKAYIQRLLSQLHALYHGERQLIEVAQLLIRQECSPPLALDALRTHMEAQQWLEEVSLPPQTEKLWVVRVALEHTDATERWTLRAADLLEPSLPGSSLSQGLGYPKQLNSLEALEDELTNIYNYIQEEIESRMGVDIAQKNGLILQLQLPKTKVLTLLARLEDAYSAEQLEPFDEDQYRCVTIYPTPRKRRTAVTCELIDRPYDGQAVGNSLRCDGSYTKQQLTALMEEKEYLFADLSGHCSSQQKVQDFIKYFRGFNCAILHLDAAADNCLHYFFTDDDNNEQQQQPLGALLDRITRRRQELREAGGEEQKRYIILWDNRAYEPPRGHALG